jgi:hypothetical protein
MKQKGNFQHMGIWREFNYKTLKHINDNYDGVIIIPMTIYIRQYYDEIAGSLINDGVRVKHFILTAGKQTIINRLVRRGDSADGWAAQHIDDCLNAFEKDMPGEKIDTENKTIDEIAIDIINLSGKEG